MYLESIFVPLLIGKLRGGKFKHFLEINIHYWWLITIAGVLEFTCSWLFKKEIGSLGPLIGDNIIWIHSITYSLLTITLLLNINYKGFVLILIGTLLNCIVIMSNEGRMPVEISQVQTSVPTEILSQLEGNLDLTHQIADENTNLYFLADIFYIPKPYPLSKSLSFGDFFIIVGIFWFTQFTMLKVQPSISQHNQESD